PERRKLTNFLTFAGQSSFRGGTDIGGIMASTMRLGVVQSEAYWGANAARMLQDAVATISQAAQRGVDLLVFPETYPGPISADVRYEVLPELQAAAAKHNV